MKASLSWIVNSVLPDQDRYHTESIIFNLRPNQGFISQFGIKPEKSYVPFLLEPTNVFFQIIRKWAARAPLAEIVEQRFPFKLHLSDGRKVAVNFKIRIFLPNILSVFVKADYIDIEELQELFSLQDIHKQKDILFMLNSIITLIITNNHKEKAPKIFPFRWKPFLKVAEIARDESLDIKTNRKRTAGILIRNRKFDQLSEVLVNTLFEKNSELNKKKISNLSLIDKQGVLLMSSDEEFNETEYKQLPRLFELALNINTFLDEFEINYKINANLTLFLLTKVIPVVKNYENILSASVSNINAWKVFLKEFRLESKLEDVLQQFESNLQSKSEYLNLLGDRWLEKRNIGDYVNSELTRLQSSKLSFIDDNQLRTIIIQDLNEAKLNYLVKSYKSTIVLCGSIIEAILRDIYVNNSHIVTVPDGIKQGILHEKKDLAFMINNLANYRIVEHNHSLISHLQSIREYRNLIHPAVSIRLGTTVSANHANIALLVVEETIDYFKNKFVSTT